MANDYVHLFVIFVHMTMKDTIFMIMVYMYIHFLEDREWKVGS